MTMTEDSGGRIRATEEKELMHLESIEEFFIKLAVLRERLERRTEQIENASKKK